MVLDWLILVQLFRVRLIATSCWRTKLKLLHHSYNTLITLKLFLPITRCFLNPKLCAMLCLSVWPYDCMFVCLLCVCVCLLFVCPSLQQQQQQQSANIPMNALGPSLGPQLASSQTPLHSTPPPAASSASTAGGATNLPLPQPSSRSSTPTLPAPAPAQGATPPCPTQSQPQTELPAAAQTQPPPQPPTTPVRLSLFACPPLLTPSSLPCKLPSLCLPCTKPSHPHPPFLSNNFIFTTVCKPPQSQWEYYTSHRKGAMICIRGGVHSCHSLRALHAKQNKQKKVVANTWLYFFLPLCPCPSLSFFPSFVFQLSQPGASLDNRVPTPASAASADLHSQHVGADLPTQEVKTETHHDQQEFEAAGGKTEPKMEVSCDCNLKWVKT